MDNDIVIIGHRGSGAGRHPVGGRENTMSSILHAAACGANEIETDLAITSDEVLVLHHDPVLPISRRSVEHVDWTALQAEIPDVLRVDTLFEMASPIRFVLELKSYTPFRKIVDVLYARHRSAITERVRFISFYQPALEYVRRLDAAVPCNFIATCRDERFDPVVRRRHIDWCRDFAVQEISGHWWTFSTGMIERAQQHLTVGLGMIDTPRRLQKCLRCGVQRMYSNRVAELRAWVQGTPR
jgi:glycerophosphoryl diester phosphodiesterase